MLQHGAYTLLLDYIYSTEKPLPSDWPSLYRICSAISKREQNAVKFVTAKYFCHEPEGWSNKRVNEEIIHTQERVKAARNNGLLGGRPKTQQEPRTKPNGLANSNPEKSYPDSRLQTPDKEESKTIQTPSALASKPTEFEVFWKCYPKKVNERAAFRAWCSTPGIHDVLDEILSALTRYEESGMWDDPQMVPNAENFIRDKRWRDEVPKKAGTKNDQRISRTLEAAKRVAETYASVDDITVRSLPAGPERTRTPNLLRLTRK